MKDKDYEFEKLVASMQPIIRSILRGLHIYKNHEEYYQIALISLWRAYQSYDPNKASLTTYAYHYIRGSILTELRKQIQKDEHEHQPDDVGWNQIANETADNKSDETWILQDIIKQLPPKQQQFIDLHFIKGHKLTEIAENLGVGYSTVKLWKREVLAALKEQLGKE
ncbi:sigma-70 family RNA polymerase sigma factor [Caldibacillus thermoamylovorans]|nr:sigma-70 family RNA polymerase sigma factor [Caldibacillus thermoamylovorans]